MNPYQVDEDLTQSTRPPLDVLHRQVEVPKSSLFPFAKFTESPGFRQPTQIVLPEESSAATPPIKEVKTTKPLVDKFVVPKELTVCMDKLIKKNPTLRSLGFDLTYALSLDDANSIIAKACETPSVGVK